MENERLEPYEAAKQFIAAYYPYCNAALVAGSAVRGGATATSDLDIVIFDARLPTSTRESIFYNGWPVEVFAHNFSSYKQLFEIDFERAIPTHQQMVKEGLVLKDNGLVYSIKQEAKQILEKGPMPWTEETITMKRYFISDALDDFIGTNRRDEGLFIANALGEWLHEFFLRTNGQWIGESKWIIRALKRYDPIFTEEFVAAFDAYYKDGEKDKVVALTDKVLAPFGGRLFHGFSM
ncbi:MAG: nucleotidyltransferase domain-containing protein [Bacillus sp. (in: Bacteria)]|nr:nucleotidyltransferase domain-containing protein [Bacillus sp. (in: firmicutes)]